ncbi:MAG: hypothetical protein KatS3mg002_1514 [Candidatus Woesearchaeota archaeon]|nr:MAG: hypothetical protein KatS3mg002_1514 [Candidatus Woesearchaeota archaeon]
MNMLLLNDREIEEKISGEIIYPRKCYNINDKNTKILEFIINAPHMKYYIYKKVPKSIDSKELNKEDFFGIYQGNGDLEVYLRSNTPF